MINETILAIIIAFAVSAILCPIVIPFLHKLKFGQQVRDDGPQAHLKKQGTPTMGGLVFLTAVVITSLLYIRDYPRIIPVLFMTVGFGVIGFLDDYIKIVMKRSEGLNPVQKLIGQFIITGIFVYYLMCSGEVETSMLVPFTGGFEHGIYLNLGFLFIPFVFFVVLGTDNGVNFTDGLDGLCTSVTILVATFLTIISIGENSGISPITGAVVGSLLGFLLFNVYPAKVFMGDTGSLALGGFVASSAFMMQMPLFIPIIGLIYLVEVLSVIMQVSYFKATHGKRIFRMAPIHHHFELGGWSETRVVAVFSIVTALLCLVAYLGI
ncbi:MULTISPECIES: phospho-N-acetylmuramoyl-pentapeptide-transferase [unclassified Clostridium]|uniref:phospho-N-acetylmuramoyl-pentapeptide- transferase n=1 Tax=unclassified Clostridium TaxID=2614128 RepID=UPI000E4B7F3C|nr:MULTISPECIES: phospho-N-acetylmuramoyl-pentapeptide-transferase [unclassified Clostridium]RHP44937.1 phospho-N-acetylmuramoyl-pentapeptide-transferase [Clostridium sp. AF32-12BH]RHV69625.1 phospho-N-acetylmuramoyl-pentapeptide-transferase [Clostridium sp. OM02-18AC]